MKIRSKGFSEEMANAMEKAGTLGLTERLRSACGPMVAAILSMRQREIVQKHKKQKGKESEKGDKSKKVKKSGSWRKNSIASNAEIVVRNSILNAINATRRTVRNANKKFAMTVLKKDDHRASAWVGRALQCWRGNSIGACASNAEILATNSILNALTARRRTARDVNKKLAMKGLKTDDHRASASLIQKESQLKFKVQRLISMFGNLRRCLNSISKGDEHPPKFRI